MSNITNNKKSTKKDLEKISKKANARALNMANKVAKDLGITPESIKAKAKAKAKEKEVNPLDLYTEEESRKATTVTLLPSPFNSFKRDNIITQHIVVNGKHVKKVIIHDTKHGYVGIATPRYRVIPHPRIIKIVNTVAEELGLKLKPLAQPALNELRGYKHQEDGSITSRDGGRMLACFTVDRSVNGTGTDDKIETGFTIVNSYDTSSSLITAPFTLRLLCGNQFMGFMQDLKNWSSPNLKSSSPQLIKAKEAYENNSLLQTTYKTVDDFLSRLRKKQTHTGLLSEEVLANQIALNIELAVGFAKDFKTLAKTPLESNEQQIQNLVDSMPVNINKELTCISLDRVNANKEPKIKPHRNVAVKKTRNGVWNNIDYKSQISQYDIFNDYTSILTHNKDLASPSMMRYLKSHRNLTRGLRFGSIQPIEVSRK